jgi:pSer/pThr/pTyr-binding forkhead associated (FHA) protein
MPNIVLKSDDVVLNTFPLAREAIIGMGSGESNHIILSGGDVSRNHAEIELMDNQYLLVDLESEFGTFVNQELIIAHALADGDCVEIGNYRLLFEYPMEELLADLQELEELALPDSGAGAEPKKEEPKEVKTSQKTVAMDTSQHRAKLVKGISDMMVSPEPKKEINGILTFLSGQEEKVKLGNEVTRIGKSPASDIVLRGLTIGKTAAVISKKPDGYYLAYVEGVAKPKVNFQTVKNEILLREFDVIEIGAYQMQFHLKN